MLSVPVGQRIGDSEPFRSFSSVFGDVTNISLPVVGVVLASRRPQNPIGWLFLGLGFTLAPSCEAVLWRR